MLSKIALTLGALVLIFALVLAAGLGVWAYGLNTQLKQARADILDLKSRHEKLNSDYSDLSTGAAKTNADLTAAQAQTESLQGQLENAQSENSSLEARISAIQAKVAILDTWNSGSEDAFERKVNASGDAELKTLWENFKKTDSDEDFWNLLDYVIQTIVDTSGVSSFPNLVLNGALMNHGSVALSGALGT